MLHDVQQPALKKLTAMNYQYRLSLSINWEVPRAGPTLASSTFFLCHIGMFPLKLQQFALHIDHEYACDFSRFLRMLEGTCPTWLS